MVNGSSATVALSKVAIGNKVSISIEKEIKIILE